MAVVNFDEAGGLTVSQADYDAFINGNDATFGPVSAAVLSAGAVNRQILADAIADGDAVKFGAGIYPFDAAVEIGREFDLRGGGRGETLLWSPQAHFLHYTSGGATYPRFSRLTVEAQGNVMRANGWSVNAIHGLLAQDCAFVSYGDHAFETDKTTAGGTGCPTYGSRFTDCGIYAGAGKAGFFEWQSGSNVFDNVVDQHIYFNKRWTISKGTMRALFWNTNVHLWCNSNISYAGMDYVYLVDRYGLYWLGLRDNLFEGNSHSFQAIAKVSTGNFHLDAAGNRYLQNSARETGHHYIFLTGNSHIRSSDSPTPLYSENMAIRNMSHATVRAVSGLVDAGNTKRRLMVFGPEAWFSASDYAPGTLTPATEALADEIHMGAMWDKYTGQISYVQRTQW